MIEKSEKRNTESKTKNIRRILAKLGLRGEDQDGAGSTNYSTWSISLVEPKSRLSSICKNVFKS